MFVGERAKVMCKRCEAKTKEEDRLHKTRETALLKVLRDRDAWKCNCKSLKVGMRAYAALNDNWNHAQKCALAPSFFGDRRWDGANKGVTIEDLTFLNSRDPKKW